MLNFKLKKIIFKFTKNSKCHISIFSLQRLSAAKCRSSFTGRQKSVTNKPTNPQTNKRTNERTNKVKSRAAFAAKNQKKF